MIIVDEQDFARRLGEVLRATPGIGSVGAVLGPGRSGAIAAAYASHMLHVPFLPYGAAVPTHLGRLLIVDTARETGRTLRKCARRYDYADPVVAVAFEEPPRVAFWYEAAKPQRYRHEVRA